MTRLFVILLSIGVVFSAYAQAPQSISYQLIVRDSLGQPLNNQNLEIKISIATALTSGSIVFEEVHSTNSNSNGLINIEIGNGAALSGALATIDWGSGPYFVETSVDANSTGIFQAISNTQLLSVPYALYANSAPLDTSLVNTLINQALSNFQGVTTSVGGFYNGGIVFNFDSLNGTGTVVAHEDINHLFSGNSRSYAEAVNGCDDLVMNGYSDWYLPSSSQLLEMYTQLGNGGFCDEYWSSVANWCTYWSVDPVSSFASLGFDFYAGSTFTSTNANDLRVRCVRDF